MRFKVIFFRHTIRKSLTFLFLIVLSSSYSCTSLRSVLNFGSSALKEGEIYKKEYQPERRTTMLIPIVFPSMVTIMPYSIKDDEDFYIFIRKWSEEKNKYKYRKMKVDKYIYEKAKIGDWFSINSEPDNPKETEDKKRKS